MGITCAFSGRRSSWILIVDSPDQVGIFGLKLKIEWGAAVLAPLQKKEAPGQVTARRAL
jgi:hypothetical protein